MPYKFDYVDDGVRAWSLTADGATTALDRDYRPAVYVAAATDEALETARGHLADDPRVARVSVERRRRGFRHDPEPMARVGLVGLDAVTAVAGDVSGWGDPGAYRLFDVDLAPVFRYCLDRKVDPTPSRPLDSLELAASEPQLARDALTELTVDGDRLAGSAAAVVDTVHERVRERDPDVLVVSSADLVPRLFEQAERHDRTEFRLGRRAGYDRLAGRSTYTSYGQVGHSPARYDVPGRVIVDRSNTFLWSRSNAAGCRYLVDRSRRPLQELAWSSIGTVLVSLQARAARERDVLVPWRSWRPEFFKSMRQLHAADRGGVTLSPAVGVHENVHELDFQSLYPNIMVTRNVSPETVRCGCHDGDDVPDLGYSICDERGYLPDVLAPLVADRDEFKRALRETDDPEVRRALRGKRSAIKWVLVSCFGYQGFANAKYGRIEAHETINAFAREILLDAKATLERHGWRVVHGIVDSLWVTPRSDADQVPLPELCDRVSAAVGIPLEYEGAYDWLAFCPRRGDDAGALTKYFGRRADPAPDEDRYKVRGVECRQRSTPPFVADAQRALLRRFDERRDPEAVCETLREWCGRLDAGQVEPSALVVTQRVSKEADAYDRRTRAALALARADHLGVPKHPGQDVAYVVADDETRTIDRVRLAFEDDLPVDTDFYRDQLLRAAESVLSPLGWRRDRIEAFLADHADATLAAFGS